MQAILVRCGKLTAFPGAGVNNINKTMEILTEMLQEGAAFSPVCKRGELIFRTPFPKLSSICAVLLKVINLTDQLHC